MGTIAGIVLTIYLAQSLGWRQGALFVVGLGAGVAPASIADRPDRTRTSNCSKRDGCETRAIEGALGRSQQGRRSMRKAGNRCGWPGPGAGVWLEDLSGDQY